MNWLFALRGRRRAGVEGTLPTADRAAQRRAGGGESAASGWSKPDRWGGGSLAEEVELDEVEELERRIALAPD